MFKFLAKKSRFFWVFTVFFYSFSSLGFSNDEDVLVDPVVLTIPKPSVGIETFLSTRDPIQPIPANDGASLLKVIPGFSVVRKGGIGGDAVFRGLAGSRLNFILDGMEFLGGRNKSNNSTYKHRVDLNRFNNCVSTIFIMYVIIINHQ